MTCILYFISLEAGSSDLTTMYLQKIMNGMWVGLASVQQTVGRAFACRGQHLISSWMRLEVVSENF